MSKIKSAFFWLSIVLLLTKTGHANETNSELDDGATAKETGPTENIEKQPTTDDKVKKKKRRKKRRKKKKRKKTSKASDEQKSTDQQSDKSHENATKSEQKQATQNIANETIDEGKNDYLFSVTLDDSIQQGKIHGKFKKKLKFKTSAFTEKVKKYRVFLVLDSKAKNVLAEIVVTKVKRKKALAYAKIIRKSPSIKIDQLIDKAIIKLDDLKKVLGNSNIFRENLTVGLGLSRSSFVLPSANILTGNDLNIVNLSTGLNLDLFVPKNPTIDWLNWLGLNLQHHKFSPSYIVLQRTNAASSERATTSGERSHLNLVVQPYFREYLFYKYTFLISPINIEKSQLEIEQVDGSIQTYKLERKYISLGLGFSFNPMPKIYAGMLINYHLSHSFSATSSDGNQSSGKWQGSNVKLWGQILYPISNTFKLNIKGHMDRHEDAISDAIDIGSGKNHYIADWSTTLLIGIAYVPE